MVWSVRSKGKEWEAGPQDRELRGRRPGGFKAVGEPEAGSHGGLAGVGMARLRAVGTGRRWEETGGRWKVSEHGGLETSNRVEKGVSNSNIRIFPL